ncbi:MAG: YgfZ/GcvT domain-containing protein [Ilumatobacteraceae bacterium]
MGSPAWFDEHHDSVTVTGADATTYLQSQLSQGILDLAVGDARWTFLLEPTGKVAVLARVTRVDDDSYRLDTDAGFGEALLARINRFKIRVRADVELTESDATAPDDAAESDRIEAGWPRMGAEIVAGETIPVETGLNQVAVDFKKGCYPGQELVERMDSRAAVAPRSLRRLDVAAGAVAGDPILDADGNAVGVLTSVSGTRALGYVKRNADIGELVTHS